MNDKKCCKNCNNCVIRHASRNVIYYECLEDSCIVEPTDRACDRFSSDTKKKN